MSGGRFHGHVARNGCQAEVHKTSENIFKPNKPKKTQNIWRDVVRPSRCNAFAIARFLVITVSARRTYTPMFQHAAVHFYRSSNLSGRGRPNSILPSLSNFAHPAVNFYKEESKSEKIGINLRPHSPLSRHIVFQRIHISVPKSPVGCADDYGRPRVGLYAYVVRRLITLIDLQRPLI